MKNNEYINAYLEILSPYVKTKNNRLNTSNLKQNLIIEQKRKSVKNRLIKKLIMQEDQQKSTITRENVASITSDEAHKSDKPKTDGNWWKKAFDGCARVVQATPILGDLISLCTLKPQKGPLINACISAYNEAETVFGSDDEFKKFKQALKTDQHLKKMVELYHIDINNDEQVKKLAGILLEQEAIAKKADQDPKYKESLIAKLSGKEKSSKSGKEIIKSLNFLKSSDQFKKLDENMQKEIKEIISKYTDKEVPDDELQKLNEFYNKVIDACQKAGMNDLVNQLKQHPQLAEQAGSELSQKQQDQLLKKMKPQQKKQCGALGFRTKKQEAGFMAMIMKMLKGVMSMFGGEDEQKKQASNDEIKQNMPDIQKFVDNKGLKPGQYPIFFNCSIDQAFAPYIKEQQSKQDKKQSEDTENKEEKSE